MSQLRGFTERGPGTDAERRAALFLASELRSGGREARVETFWCRPARELAQAWQAALAIAGSLLSVHSARLGAVVLAVALVDAAADAWLGTSLARRLTPERASQNVLSLPRAEPPGPRRLLILAGYDLPRAGLLQRRLKGRATGPATAIVLAAGCIWLLIGTALRAHGDRGLPVGIVQLIPTAGLVILLALLLEAAGAHYGGPPASAKDAPDAGAGAAVALAVTRALDAAPPAHLDVELLLAGAHAGGALGWRRYRRGHRSAPVAAETLILGPGRLPPSRRPCLRLTGAGETPERTLARALELVDGLDARYARQLAAAGQAPQPGSIPA